MLCAFITMLKVVLLGLNKNIYSDTVDRSSWLKNSLFRAYKKPPQIQNTECEKRTTTVEISSPEPSVSQSNHSDSPSVPYSHGGTFFR